MIWSGSRLNFCQSLPRPHTSLWRFLFSMEWIGETFPRIWQASVRIAIPIVIDTFLLHDVQISVSRPGHSGTGNVSSFGTQSWTWGLLCWRQMRASASSFDSVGWDPPSSPWSSPLRSSFFTVCSRRGVGSRNSWSLTDNFAVPSAAGNINSSPSCVIWILLSRWFCEDKFLMRQTFPILPDLQSVGLF